MQLSIIVPIYNVELYLEECLQSIYSISDIQKEVILVNDGSTDNSQKIIDKYKKIYNDETKVITQENKGLSSARNVGLLHAKGKYILFIDSDDYIDDNLFKEMINKCMNLDLDIAFGELNYYRNGKSYITKEIENRVKKLESLPILSGLEYWEECLEKEKDSIRVEVVTNVYKKSFLEENNINFKEKLLHEDTLFMFEAISKAKKVKYFPYRFYFYRTREGSIMGNSSIKNYIHKLYIAQELQNMKEKEKINLYSWDTLIFALYFSAVKKYKIKNKNLYKRIKNNSKLTLKSKIKKILVKFYHIYSKDVNIEI